MLGYFQSSSISTGGLFELIASPPSLTLAGLDSCSGQNLDSGKANAKGYLVKATASRLSSDFIGVTVNGVRVDLGSSDSHAGKAQWEPGGLYAGAKWSPVHSETFFVPANPDDPTHPGILQVSTNFNDSWKASHSGDSFNNGNDAKIEVEVLGYFGTDGQYGYSAAYTSLGNLDNNPNNPATKTLSAST
jgi:hypothetical protein